MLRQTILACAALAALSSAAAAQDRTEPPPDEPAPEARDCFLNSQIAGWGMIDGRTVRVRVNNQRVYALHTVGNARRVRWEMVIALTSRSGWICTGREMGVELHVFGATPRSWVVDSVERLPPIGVETEQAPEEAAAAQPAP